MDKEVRLDGGPRLLGCAGLAATCSACTVVKYRSQAANSTAFRMNRATPCSHVISSGELCNVCFLCHVS